MLAIQKRFTAGFFALLSLPATAMGFALSVQISALSWILSTQFGLDIHEVGIVWAAGPLAGILGQVIIGFISDKVWFWGGRRRPFILIGGTLAALSLLALPNIGVINDHMGIGSIMAVALFVALTLDLAINISFNPTRSLIADVTPEGEKRTKGYTWMQTISGMFGVFAYIIGAIWGNFTLIYLSVGIVLVFSVLPTLLIAEPPQLTVREPSQPGIPSGKTQYGELNRIYLAHGFCWLGVQTMFVYIFAFIQHELPAMDETSIGQTIAISFAILNTVGFLVPTLLLAPLAKKWGRVKVHSLAMASMALAYGAIAWGIHEVMGLYFWMLVAGIGWGATVSLPFAIMTEKVNKAKMGLFMGIFNLSVVLPQLIVSLGFGKVIEKAADKSMVFIICMVCLALSALFWTFVKDTTVDDSIPTVNTPQ
jgi:maltose/moltooligosaccharide transporter